MARIRPTLRGTAALLSMALAATPAMAGKTGVSGLGGLPVFVPPVVVADDSPSGSEVVVTLDQVPGAISSANAGCGAAGAYRVDCLADALARTAAAMPSGEAATEIIAEAARDMAALAATNRDRGLPTAHLRQGDRRISGRLLTPADRSRSAAIDAEASAIMERAERQLLRSSTGSAQRRAQYQRIAVAVGSTKVLLRSS